jgi:RNA polymerase sigma-70 factor (ECF subfamily)
MAMASGQPQPGPEVPPSGVTSPEVAGDELALVDAVLRRDRKAAAELVDRYADAVYGYVRHRLAPRLDRVDDLVQEVFLAALASLAGFRGASPLRSWLLGIARHKVENYYRDQLRQPGPLVDDEAEPLAELPVQDETLDRERAAHRTQRILRQLPEAYSLALLWRYWEGRSAREMADATGRTEKAIERMLARARARFRELWEQE